MAMVEGSLPFPLSSSTFFSLFLFCWVFLKKKKTKTFFFCFVASGLVWLINSRDPQTKFNGVEEFDPLSFFNECLHKFSFSEP